MISESFFQPMGFSLRLLSNSPAIVNAATASFGRFGPATPTDAPDLTFHLFAHALEEPPPGSPTYRTAGDLVYQTTGVSTLLADRGRGLAYGYFSPQVLANPAYFRWHFLELAFFVMLARRGLMGVHGAAIARNDQAILLRAPSGGGKTTLAYAAARHRFQALAEDVVWLDFAEERWWGTPWHFHLLPDAKKLFPELAGHEPVLQINQECKLEVDLEQLRAGSTTVSARPGPIVLVQRTPGQPSRLEPLPLPSARSLWLAAQTGAELAYPDYHRHLDALLDDNAYRLTSGDDFESSLDLLETLIA